MPSIDDLMRTNLLEVFGQRDAELRRATIARTYQPDAVFSDHDGDVVGHAALDAAVAKLHERVGDLPFRDVGEVQRVGDLGYLAWELGPEGAPVVRGADIAFTQDGLISKLYVVLTGA